jgi:hypothetical protein
LVNFYLPLSQINLAVIAFCARHYHQISIQLTIEYLSGFARYRPFFHFSAPSAEVPGAAGSVVCLTMPI